MLTLGDKTMNGKDEAQQTIIEIVKTLDRDITSLRRSLDSATSSINRCNYIVVVGGLAITASPAGKTKAVLPHIATRFEKADAEKMASMVKNRAGSLGSAVPWKTAVKNSIALKVLSREQWAEGLN